MPSLRAPMQLRDRDDLSRLMRLKNLNDRALAQAAGLYYTTIYRLRTRDGAPTHLDTASAIADALGVEVDRLFRPMDPNASSEHLPPEGES